jgi:hypothetical protein
MVHFQDSWFQCDNSQGGVSAYAYQVSAPTTVASGTDFNGLTFDIGAGMVQIRTDWADTGVLGCPQDAAGNHRLMIVVQANDGTGLLASISGADPGTGYQVENAHTFDAVGGAVLALPCGTTNGRPALLSFTSTTVDVNVRAPHIYSDCDPDSVFAAGLGLPCPDGFDSAAAAATIGGIYTSTQPCGQRPIVTRSSWARSTATPDASGFATVPYTKPDNTGKTCATDPTCLCAFIGTTTSVGGVEGGSINGFIQVAGFLAASPKAENVRAAFDSGKVTASWSTSNELGLAGFRLLTSTKSKGQFEIGSFKAATGSPSTYSVTLGMGEFKGGRTLIIRAVLTDGTTVDAAPVNF